jgi:hypothetical protein
MICRRIASSQPFSKGEGLKKRKFNGLSIKVLPFGEDERGLRRLGEANGKLGLILLLD